jgi:hypothetical protein
MSSQGSNDTASEVEARPASPATSSQDHSLCNQEMAMLRRLNEIQGAYIAKLETTTAQLTGQHESMTALREANHNLTVKLLKREHELLVGELKAAHATTTTKLNGEMATLRGEMASLRAQHTGRENGAERESAEVPEELSEVQK